MTLLPVSKRGTKVQEIGNGEFYQNLIYLHSFFSTASPFQVIETTLPPPHQRQPPAQGERFTPETRSAVCRPSPAGAQVRALR